MDFSASTDLHDCAEESLHVIIPRSPKTPKRSTKPALVLDPSPPSYYSRAGLHTVKKSNFNVESFDATYLSCIKPQEREFSKKSEFYLTTWKSSHENRQNNVNYKYNKITNPTQAAKIGQNLFFDSDIFLRIKRKNFRKTKWNNFHNRCKTALMNDDSNEIEDRKYYRKFKDIKFMKKELIPQTKANSSKNNQPPYSALRIKGIIKDISMRNKQKSYSINS